MHRANILAVIAGILGHIKYNLSSQRDTAVTDAL